MVFANILLCIITYHFAILGFIRTVSTAAETAV